METTWAEKVAQAEADMQSAKPDWQEAERIVDEAEARLVEARIQAGEES